MEWRNLPWSVKMFFIAILIDIAIWIFIYYFTRTGEGALGFLMIAGFITFLLIFIGLLIDIFSKRNSYYRSFLLWGLTGGLLLACILLLSQGHLQDWNYFDWIWHFLYYSVIGMVLGLVIGKFKQKIA